MASTRPRWNAGSTEALHLASVEPVRLGMPELCRAGLSETWLWKACGHRHWLALAAAHGLDQPEFRDPDGARLYPAFTDIRLENGQLDAVTEHGILDFDVTLERASLTRFRSRIVVRTGALVIAQIFMESAFVRRAIAGSNFSARRGLVAGPSRLLPPVVSEPPFRLGTWSDAHGFRREDRQEIASRIVDPSPHEDFNGADFLYFAAFQAIVDRAEWCWFRRFNPALVTASRRLVYGGNIELGDRLVATLCGVHESEASLSSWIELARASDSIPIALALAHRVPLRRRRVGESIP